MGCYPPKVYFRTSSLTNCVYTWMPHLFDGWTWIPLAFLRIWHQEWRKSGQVFANASSPPTVIEVEFVLVTFVYFWWKRFHNCGQEGPGWLNKPKMLKYGLSLQRLKKKKGHRNEIHCTGNKTREHLAKNATVLLLHLSLLWRRAKFWNFLLFSMQQQKLQVWNAAYSLFRTCAPLQSIWQKKQSLFTATSIWSINPIQKNK